MTDQGDRRPTTGAQGDTGGEGIERRDYLRTLGAGTTLSAFGAGLGGTAAAQQGFDEAAADRRIRENQTGSLTVEVVDENGDPVSGADVDVEMTEHDFVWGAEVAADLLVERYSEGDPYIDNFLELFNTAVLENIHKWAIWEGNQERADAAVDWLVDHEYRIRGHTCIYPVDYAVPSDVMTAIDQNDAQTIRDRTMQQIEDIITHYGDDIMEWDVVNEVTHRGLIHSGVYPDQIDLDNLEQGAMQPWTSPLLADWFGKAESVIDENGLDVDVVTNDYNTITWANDRRKYTEQIDHLQSQGVGVDGIGLQAHIGSQKDGSDPWTYANIESVFENYAQFDTNVRITEYDMTGDGWSGQQQRADVMRKFLKTAYGHPNVDEFTVWGFWDNAHWRDEAPFFQEDWSEKPALDVFRGLVHDEWWTDESGTTSGDGTVTVDAFLGEHEIAVNGTVVGTASVTSPAGTTVQVDGSGVTTPDDGPPRIGENANAPTDPDGDGQYEDLTGNGETDPADVVTLFDNLDDPAVADHPEYYDFSGNGEIEVADVVELFGEL